MLNTIMDDVEAAHRPSHINRPTASLTARGHAAVSLYRFLTLLRGLDVVDREYILGMLTEELPQLAPIA